jgi:predicted metalloprotease with PDZ domain
MGISGKAAWAALLWMLALAETAAQSAPDRVTHHLSFPRPGDQYVRVVSRFPVSGESATLVMANWNPGSYLIREFAANLDRLVAHNADGEALPLTKVRKNAWRVDLRGSGRLVAEYDVRAGELSVNTSWVSPDFVLINPASVILFTRESMDLPQTLRVEVPEGMGRLATPLPLADGPGRLEARDFDELVDSPLVISQATPRGFSSHGHEYHFLNVGGAELWDTARATDDLRRVVATTNEFWGKVPLRRDYWFLNFLVELKGGLEHDHGTVMMASRWQMRDRDDYIQWLGLAAHEYFHLWNVRHLRPRAIAEYDYENEQYSSALWLAEGISSYYDNLLLSRAGLVDPQEYLQRLSADFHRLELTPGRQRISLRDASRDAWIRYYRPDNHSINSEVSYYTKGAVLGFALDARIREETRGRSSLDDAMRLMWDRWSGQPYPEGAFEEAVAAVAGPAVGDWLRPLLDTPADPDIDRALDWFGLELVRRPQQAVATVSGQSPKAGLGVNWNGQGDGLFAASVVAGFSGAEAGMLPGDELLAIDGERVTGGNLADRLKRLNPGETVELLVARRARIMTLVATLGEARPTAYEIRLGESFNNRELRRLNDWLGQDLRDSAD